MLPLRHDGDEHQERVTLRRHIREALRLTYHIEHRQRSALEGLAAATMLASVVDRLRGELVRGALRHGATWNEIGRALGVSKQAAHARYRDYPPVSDTRSR